MNCTHPAIFAASRGIFTRTLRHTFVPRFYVKDDPQDWRAPWRVVDGANLDDRAEWLDGVYSNQTLITELKDQRIPEELGGGAAQTITSSSTLPGLMVSMLETLDAQDNHQVLEIGTGTGYNAALLSGRVGDRNLTSVDIGPALVDAARRRLADHGFHPHLTANNGDRGVPERAPFDRIIATCSVARVPYAWVRQTRPGGIILVNVAGPLMPGALARLTVTDDRTAVGPFQPGRAAFMPLRDNPDSPYTPPPAPTVTDDDGVETLSRLSPHPLHPIGGSSPWGSSSRLSFPVYTPDEPICTTTTSAPGSARRTGHGHWWPTPRGRVVTAHSRAGPTDCGISWKPPTNNGLS